jgi:hypothetical protein
LSQDVSCPYLIKCVTPIADNEILDFELVLKLVEIWGLREWGKYILHMGWTLISGIQHVDFARLDNDPKKHSGSNP